jgi:hypothetical protein
MYNFKKNTMMQNIQFMQQIKSLCAKLLLALFLLESCSGVPSPIIRELQQTEKCNTPQTITKPPRESVATEDGLAITPITSLATEQAKTTDTATGGQQLTASCLHPIFRTRDLK